MPDPAQIKSPFKPGSVDDGWRLDVDDGWFLDEEPDQYYAEYVVERPASNRKRMYGFVYGAVTAKPRSHP